MASNNSSSGSKKILVPEARAAMDQFKMEAANDLDVPVPYRKHPNNYLNEPA